VVLVIKIRSVVLLSNGLLCSWLYVGVVIWCVYARVIFQATKFSPEVIQENVELLLECLPQRHNWRPVSNFMRLGGIHLLMELVSMAVDWTTYTGKSVSAFVFLCTPSLHYALHCIQTYVIKYLRTVESSFEAIW